MFEYYVIYFMYRIFLFEYSIFTWDSVNYELFLLPYHVNLAYGFHFEDEPLLSSVMLP